jgi:hypothetical protein
VAPDDFSAITTYTLTVTRSDGVVVKEDAMDLDGGTTVDNLAVGLSYTFTVRGYVGGFTEDATPVAEGTAENVQIETGDTSVDITLGPVASETETGTFSYDITLPEGFSEAILTVTKMNGDAVTGNAVVSAGTVDLTENSQTGNLTLYAGTYSLAVSVTLPRVGDDDTAGFAFEVIHVYAGLNSALPPKTYTTDDFVTLMVEIAGMETDSSNRTQVLLTGDVTLDENTVTALEIPKGVTLNTNGHKLTISDDAVLTVNGTLSVDGTLDVEGTLSVADNATVNLTDADAAIEVSGTYELGNNVTGANAGTVTVTSTGTIINGTITIDDETGEEIGTGINITGNGTNVVEFGGTVHFGRATPFIGSTNAAEFQLTRGSFSYDSTGYVLDGEVTLNGRVNANSDTLGNGKNSWLINATDQTLTINPGSVFTVAANTWLILRNDANGSCPVVGGTTVGGAAPQIIFANGSAVQPDLPSNFYANNNSAAFTGWSTTFSSGKTFNWDAAAGGGGTEGWKATTS